MLSWPGDIPVSPELPSTSSADTSLGISWARGWTQQASPFAETHSGVTARGESENGSLRVCWGLCLSFPPPGRAGGGGSAMGGCLRGTQHLPALGSHRWDSSCISWAGNTPRGLFSQEAPAWLQLGRGWARDEFKDGIIPVQILIKPSPNPPSTRLSRALISPEQQDFVNNSKSLRC